MRKAPNGVRAWLDENVTRWIRLNLVGAGLVAIAAAATVAVTLVVFYLMSIIVVKNLVPMRDIELAAETLAILGVLLVFVADALSSRQELENWLRFQPPLRSPDGRRLFFVPSPPASPEIDAVERAVNRGLLPSPLLALAQLNVDQGAVVTSFMQSTRIMVKFLSDLLCSGPRLTGAVVSMLGASARLWIVDRESSATVLSLLLSVDSSVPVEEVGGRIQRRDLTSVLAQSREATRVPPSLRAAFFPELAEDGVLVSAEPVGLTLSPALRAELGRRSLRASRGPRR